MGIHIEIILGLYGMWGFVLRLYRVCKATAQSR